MRIFILKIILFLAVLNTGYLSWRYLALEANWVEPGTGFCSITEAIDCDKVLSTNEARAFYFPNALLGFGFFFGCLLWLIIGYRFPESYHYYIIRTLVFWLAVAAIFTFRFFWLLIHLDAFCPLCPWNHLLTYIALILALIIWQKTPKPKEKISLKPLILLATFCVLQFYLGLFLWLILMRTK